MLTLKTQEYTIIPHVLHFCFLYFYVGCLKILVKTYDLANGFREIRRSMVLIKMEYRSIINEFQKPQ